MFCLTHATAQPSDQPLAIEAQLGVLLTSGNTDSSSLKAKLDVKQELARWRNRYILEALYKEDDVLVEVGGETIRESQVSAEKYFASTQADYKLNNENRGFFVFGSYEVDQFSGYEYQAALAAGYSDRLFQTPRAYFDYSIGPGMSFTRTEAIFDNAGNLVSDEVSDESAMLRVSALYEFAFNDNTKFTQTFSSDIALESEANTKTRSESALTATLTESFAMKAALTISHNTEVPEDRVSRDTQTSITLVYTL